MITLAREIRGNVEDEIFLWYQQRGTSLDYRASVCIGGYIASLFQVPYYIIPGVQNTDWYGRTGSRQPRALSQGIKGKIWISPAFPFRD